jgi:hypothetical protein
LSKEGWLYEGREQSYVKHEILKRYLEQFAIIVGSFSPVSRTSIASGPWRNRDDEAFQDTCSAWQSQRSVVLVKPFRSIGTRPLICGASSWKRR